MSSERTNLGKAFKMSTLSYSYFMNGQGKNVKLARIRMGWTVDNTHGVVPRAACLLCSTDCCESRLIHHWLGMGHVTECRLMTAELVRRLKTATGVQKNKMGPRATSLLESLNLVAPAPTASTAASDAGSDGGAASLGGAGSDAGSTRGSTGSTRGSGRASGSGGLFPSQARARFGGPATREQQQEAKLQQLQLATRLGIPMRKMRGDAWAKFVRWLGGGFTPILHARDCVEHKHCATCTEDCVHESLWTVYVGRIEKQRYEVAGVSYAFYSLTVLQLLLFFVFTL